MAHAQAGAEGYRLDQEVPYLMTRLVHRLNTEFVPALRGHGLTLQHWRIIAILAVSGQRSIAELAEITMAPHSTLSRVLDGMERLALVQRSPSSKDRRIAEVSLLGKGRRLYREIVPLARAINASVVLNLSVAERRSLARLLRRMMQLK